MFALRANARGPRSNPIGLAASLIGVAQDTPTGAKAFTIIWTDGAPQMQQIGRAHV